MNEKAKRICIMLLVALLELIIYIVLHEGGHALIAALCGAKITAFSIVGAYTVSTGGTYTQLTSFLLELAGVALPIIPFGRLHDIYFKKNKKG